MIPKNYNLKNIRCYYQSPLKSKLTTYQQGIENDFEIFEFELKTN